MDGAYFTGEIAGTDIGVFFVSLEEAGEVLGQKFYPSPEVKNLAGLKFARLQLIEQRFRVTGI